MKLQTLAIIFIIIILPISIVISEYGKSQIKTLDLQTSYDTKLLNSTYDAIKAFQLNTFSTSTSDLSNTKIRTIEASVNTFFNSASANFNLEGYNEETLKYYVPALVYTLYDGYYIYTPFTNTLTNVDVSDDATYKDQESTWGLRPYIYYSAKYTLGGDDFVVITYALDNYVTIKGKKGNEVINLSGYLLSNVSATNATATYRGVTIEKENALSEYIDDNQQYQYVKVNGVKYYKKNDNETFAIINDKEYKQDKYNVEPNDSAVRYYKEAVKLKNELVRLGLNDLRTSALVDEDLTSEEKTNRFGDHKIFDFDHTSGIEEADSDFNQHRLAVIRYSIEKNLSVVISNYNNYSGVQTNFQMPKLKEDEWDKILNNISLISFLQGLSIGGKVYNGYAIVPNSKNEELISENSIYILAKNSSGEEEYHRVTDTELTNSSKYNLSNAIGIYNMDFERRNRQIEDNNGNTTKIYFYPRRQLGCYNCIIGHSTVYKDSDGNTSINKYLDSIGNAGNAAILKKAYYTALGRERYSMYKVTNDLQAVQEGFR